MGNDRPIGGAGDDTLIGGAGNDTFVFNPGFGNDVITDFGDVANNDDILEFSTSVFADFAAVQLATAQVGADIVITVTASDLLTIKNKTIATWTQMTSILFECRSGNTSKGLSEYV